MARQVGSRDWRGLFPFSCCSRHQDLHSFPTRRSSDLVTSGLPATPDMALHAQTDALCQTRRSEGHTSELQSRQWRGCRLSLVYSRVAWTCRSHFSSVGSHSDPELLPLIRSTPSRAIKCAHYFPSSACLYHFPRLQLLTPKMKRLRF